MHPVIRLLGFMSAVSAFTTTAPFAQRSVVVASSSSASSSASPSPSSSLWSPKSSSALSVSSVDDNGDDNKPEELFKAGLLANLEEEAADLASKKVKSVVDLGWKGSAKRRGNTRPRHWAFGGAGEKAVQDKPNYDPDAPLCVEKWVSLPDFYRIVKDKTAVADTIFVALAKGGAFIERDVAEEVIASWQQPPATTTKTTTTMTKRGGRGGKGKTAFDKAAFQKSVQAGRVDFLIGWAAFVSLTGFAVAGIVFPTNPLQLALVDLLDIITQQSTKTAL